MRYGTDFEWLFQQFSIVISAFKYAHLMDGDLIELNQAFLLWHSMFNKHCIEILHIGEAYQFIDLSFASNDFLRQRHKKTTWILA